MIKLALAEDNLFALNALKEKLSIYKDLAIIHTARHGAELLDLLIENSDINLILMDIEMPVMNGIEATKKIKQRFPSIKIVMITIYDADDYIFEAIKVGANSYILKETKAEKIYEAIIDTLNGGSVMSPSIAFKTLQLLISKTHSTPKKELENIALSKREIEILEQISNGYTNKHIGNNLYISPFTVKRHVENIYYKLQAHNRIELLDKARKSGLI
ncbi:Transcriptional regulatory protein DegU [anaerobic digester metagenome]|nr:response regulator transcription factor [Lentimicrobiaceae bacterium]